jgi:hypothetical protein
MFENVVKNDEIWGFCWRGEGHAGMNQSEIKVEKLSTQLDIRSVVVISNYVPPRISERYEVPAATSTPFDYCP